jgi:hypothetical protein
MYEERERERDNKIYEKKKVLLLFLGPSSLERV